MRKSKLLSWMACLFLVSCGGSEGLMPVKILAPDGGLRREFQAELADEPAERSQGLMYRQELGKDRGMLFVFPENTESPFWMKNTLIPLDMIFIGEDRRIVSIVERADPQTTIPREPAGPYRYVLEVEGGRSAETGIKSGDGVQFDLAH